MGTVPDQPSTAAESDLAEATPAGT
jgi:hypothetical protein